MDKYLTWIVIIFKWDNIYQEFALSHKHEIVFFFFFFFFLVGICSKYAQNNLIFSTLWVMLTLIPINYKYPTFHIICQNKIFPTLRNHSVIWLTWKHFGQCSKTLNYFFLLLNQVICFKDEFDLNILPKIHLKQHQQTYILPNGHTKIISNSNGECPPQNV